MNIEKNNIRLLFIITIIITSVLSTTYAFLQFEKTASTYESQAGCFVVDYTGTNVTLSGLTSTTESNYTNGAHHARVTLKKNADCQIYTEASIHLHTDETNTSPLNGTPALKFKVLSGNSVISSGTINNPSDANAVPTNFSIDLATNLLLSTTTTTYDIYIWLDKTKSLGEYHGKTYSGNIYATSEQTSDIKN